MAEKHDIKELKEAIEAVLVIGAEMAIRLKDGADLGDVGALWDKWKNDAEFKAVIEAGYTDISKVSDEVSDLSISEMVEIISLLIAKAPALIEAIKGKKEETADAS